MKKVELDLAKIDGIKEIFYQKSLLHIVNENIKKISLFVLILSSVMLLIAITLINNTIRLLIYSKRFIIRTMQLVGASNDFIRRPFLFYSILQGLLSAIFSVSLLYFILKLIEKELDGFVIIRNINSLIVMAIIIFIISIIINFISTYIAVNKYLNIDVDKLY